MIAGLIVTSSCTNTVRNPGHFTSGSTFITSPNYPKPYLDNTECFWNISVPCQGRVPTKEFPEIKVSFDIFQLHSNEDVLEVKIGNRLLKRIRGNEIPEPMFFKEQFIE